MEGGAGWGVEVGDGVGGGVGAEGDGLRGRGDLNIQLYDH